jgi:hypothetical protein
MTRPVTNACGACAISNCKTAFTPCIKIHGKTYVHALIHQERTVDAVYHILQMPSLEFEAYCINDGFGKTIRNYQYVAAEVGPNFNIYKTKASPHFFRMTRMAHNLLEIDPRQLSEGGIHSEHAVPIDYAKQRLVALRDQYSPAPVPKDEIRTVLRATEIILVHRDERERLDGSLKRACTAGPGLNLRKIMPQPWKWGDCHLARICLVANELLGERKVG